MTEARTRILCPLLGVTALAALAVLIAWSNAGTPPGVAAWLGLGAVALAGALTVVLLTRGPRAVIAAGVVAAVWFVAAAVSGISAFATTPLPAAPGAEPTLDYFVFHTVPGRAWLGVGIAALISSILCLASRHRIARGLALAASVVGMIALSSVATAAPLAEGTAAQLRTGRELPPAPTPLTWASVWEVDALMLSFVVGLAIIFVWRSAGRASAGFGISAGRMVSGALGIVILTWITQGAVERYHSVLFSAHLLQLLCAVFIVGPLLAWGGVVTFGRDGNALLAGRPVAVALVVALGLGGYLFSPALRGGVADPTLHTVVLLASVAAGAALVVAARNSTRVSWLLSAALMLGALSAVAALLHFGSMLLVAEWFGGMGRVWSADALADQRGSAVLVWVVGVIPAVLLWAAPAGVARAYFQRRATIVGSPASVNSTS